MCGRATLTCGVEEIAEHFDVAPVPLGPPRFNVAPGQPLAVVRAPLSRGNRSSGATRSRELALVRWGLVPWWAKDAKIASRCIQGRAETLAKSPAYRDAFRERRCLVVLSGFYEWKSVDGARFPHHVRPRWGGPLAVAGVWERWLSPEGEVVETCAVVTTKAEGPVGELHDRMPMIVGEPDYEAWLRGSSADAERVLTGSSADADELVVTPVSAWVNDVRHEDPRCLARADHAPAAERRGEQIKLRFD
jgi:putative SOS response-associated peptidase YedK